MPGVRTSYCSTMRSESARAPSRLIQCPLTLGSRVWWPRMRFSHSGESSSRPWRWRSSGMYPTPEARRCRVPQEVTSSSESSTAPLAGRSMPTTASTSSVWPLPSTPAMPSTSPAWIVKSMSLSTARPVESTTSRSRTWSTSRSVTVDSSVPGLGSSSPTMSSASSCWVTSSGLTEATVVPRRSTVMSSAIARTSSSLWEMKSRVLPLLLRSRRFSKSASTSCGTSTAVGSSRMMMLAPR